MNTTRLRWVSVLVLIMVKLCTDDSTHESLLFKQVTGFFSFFAVLIFKLLKPGFDS